jgi:hypothetical protein
MHDAGSEIEPVQNRANQTVSTNTSLVDGHRTASNLLYDVQHEEQAQRQVQTRKAQRRENDVAGVDLGRAARMFCVFNGDL